MMNRKTYLAILILLGVASVAVAVTNAIYAYVDWLWILLGVLTAWTILRARVLAPLQTFGTRFTLLVDYDLAIDEAVRLAREGASHAPTAKTQAIYQMYLGMALYYSGDYEGAIRTFNLIDLRRLEAVYHVLIVAFIAYSAYESDDREGFTAAIERLKTIRGNVGPRYTQFAENYIEILEALAVLESDPERYREVVDKHFSRDDGYISTKLIHHYRLARYFRQIGDLAEMDKQLAFVIANGGAHHTVKQAQRYFTGTVDVADYVVHDQAETVEPTDETPSLGDETPSLGDGTPRDEEDQSQK